MDEFILRTHEAGRRGKPDRLDADIAHLIGAYLLSRDSRARFDVRVHGSMEEGKPVVRVTGEISEHLLGGTLATDIMGVVHQHYEEVHHQTARLVLPFVESEGIKPQVPVLAQNSHAGDSGVAIAVAYANTLGYQPLERLLAVEIRDCIDHAYGNDGEIPPHFNNGSGSKISGIGADGKIGVEIVYWGASPLSLETITIAVNHEHDMLEELREEIEVAVTTYLANVRSFAPDVSLRIHSIIVNGNGPWENRGGWSVDAGCREAKPQNAFFGSYGNAADSPWGEDPSKPEGTGTMLARYIAVQIVSNKLAEFAKVTLSYTIGRTQPRLNITTQGTGRVSQDEMERWIKRELEDLSITATTERFQLRKPELYKQLAQRSDMFHDPVLPWNRVELLY